MEKEIFRALVKALEKFTEDGDVIFHGNRFREMNEGHAALLDVHFPWLKSRRYWTLPFEALNEVSKRKFKYINIERVTKKTLHLKTHHPYEGEKVVKIPLLEAYDLRKAPRMVKPPKIKLEAKVAYLDNSFPDLFKIAKDMKADKVRLRVEGRPPEQKLNIVLQSGDGFAYEDGYKRIYDHSDYLGPDGTQAIYSIDLLSLMAPLLKHAYPCTLSFGADKPLKLSMNIWTLITATYWLAPRIED